MSDKNARSYKPDVRGSKQKFQSITTTAFKSKQGLDQAGKGPVPYSKPGLASLGKVSGRRIPKPHIESKRTENFGEDPDVQLVPKDGSGWAKSADDGDNGGTRKGDAIAGSSSQSGGFLNASTKLWSDPNALGSSSRPVRTANPNEFPTLSAGTKPESPENNSSSFSLKPNRPSWKQGASGKYDDRERPYKTSEVEQDAEYSHYPDMKPSFMKPKDPNNQKSGGSSGNGQVSRTGKREEWKGQTVIKESKELDKIVELDKDADGWAGASGEVDYNKKIVFSDDEEGGTDSGGSTERQERKQQRNFTSSEASRRAAHKDYEKSGERRDGEFFRSSSTRGSDNKYSTNNMRRSDSFFQSSTDRGASDRGDNQQRRSNSFYDQRSSGAQHYEQRNRNDLQTSGGSKNAPGSRQEYDNRRGPDFNNRSGSTATGYPAPSNPPFPPSNKTFSTAQSGNNNFQSHEAKIQMERNRSYIGNQDYEKKPGRDDEKPHRSSKRDDGRYNNPDKSLQNATGNGSNSMGRYDNNASGSFNGSNSNRSNNAQAPPRNRYDSEGSNGSGKADAMRVQMQFKAPDPSAMMKNPPVPTTAPPMFFPPPPPPPQLMNQMAQQQFNNQMWVQYQQMLMAARFPFPMQPPFPAPPMALPSTDLPNTSTGSETIPRPPPEGAASIAESPMSILAPPGKTSKAQTQTNATVNQTQRTSSPIIDNSYSPPPPKEEVKTRRVQRTKKVQLTDSSQPDPSEKPADEPVKILERPKDKGKEQKAISAASLFHTPKNDEGDSSNNEGKDKENPAPARFTSKRQQDSGASHLSKYDRVESQWGDDERDYESQKHPQSFQSKEKQRSGYNTNYQDSRNDRNRDSRDYRTNYQTQDRRSNMYDDFDDEGYGYRKQRQPTRDKEAPPSGPIKELTSPIGDHFGRSPANQSRAMEVRRGGRGLGFSRQGPPHSIRARDREYTNPSRPNAGQDFGDEDEYPYDPPPPPPARSREEKGSPIKFQHYEKKEPSDIEVKDLMSLEIRYDDLSENNRQKLEQDFLGSGSRRSDNNERYGKRFSSSAVASRGNRNNPAGRRLMSGSGGSFDSAQMQNERDNRHEVKEFSTSKNYLSQQHLKGSDDKKSESLTQSDPVSMVSTTDSAAENSSVSNTSSKPPLVSSVVDWNAQNAASTLFSDPNRADIAANLKEPLTIKTSSATSTSLKSEDAEEFKENSEPKKEAAISHSVNSNVDSSGVEAGNEDLSENEQSRRQGKGTLRSSGAKTRGGSAGATWEIKSNAAVRASRGGSCRRGGSVGGVAPSAVGKQSSRSNYYDSMYYYGSEWDYYYSGNYQEYDYGYGQGYMNYRSSNDYSRNPNSFYTMSATQAASSRKLTTRGGKTASVVSATGSRRGMGKERRRPGVPRASRGEPSPSMKNFDSTNERFPTGSADQMNQEEWETASESSDFDKRDSKNDKVPVAGTDRSHTTQTSIPTHSRNNEQRYGKSSAPSKKSFSSQRPLADRGRDKHSADTASKYSSDSKLMKSKKEGDKPEEKAPASAGPPRRRGPEFSQYDVNRMSGIVVIEDQQNLRPNIASDDDCADESFQEVISKRSKAQKAAASKKSASPTSQQGGKEKSPRVKGGISKRSSKGGHEKPKKGSVTGADERPSRGKSGTPNSKDDHSTMRNIQNFESLQRQFARSGNDQQHEHAVQSDPASSGKTSMPTTPPPARSANAWSKPLQTTLILQDNQLVPSLPMATMSKDFSTASSDAGVHGSSNDSPWISSQAKSHFSSAQVGNADHKKMNRKEVAPQSQAVQPRQFTSAMYKMQQMTSTTNERAQMKPPEMSPVSHQQSNLSSNDRSEVTGAPPRIEQPSIPNLNNDNSALFFNENDQNEYNKFLKDFENKGNKLNVNDTGTNNVDAAMASHADALNLGESVDDSSIKMVDMENQFKKLMWDSNKDDDYGLDETPTNSMVQTQAAPATMINNIAGSGESLVIASKSLGIVQGTPSSATTLEQSRICKVKPVTQNTSMGHLRSQIVPPSASLNTPGGIGLQDFQTSMEMSNHLSNSALMAHGLSVSQQAAFFDDALGYPGGYGTASNAINPAASGSFFDQQTGNAFTDAQAAAVVAAQQQQSQSQIGHQSFMGQKPQQNIGTVPPQPHQSNNNSIGAGGWNSNGHFAMYPDQPSQNNPLGAGLGQSANSPYQQTVYNQMGNSFGPNAAAQSSFSAFGYSPMMGLGPRPQQTNHSHPFMQPQSQNPQQHNNYGHMMNSNALQPGLNNATFPSPQHPVQSFELSLGAFGAAQGHPGGKAMSPQSHQQPGDFKNEFSMYGLSDAFSATFKPEQSQAFLAGYGAAKGNTHFLQGSSSFNNGNGSNMQQQQMNANSGFHNGNSSFMGNKMLSGFTKPEMIQAAHKLNMGSSYPGHFGVGSSAQGPFHKTGPNSIQMGGTSSNAVAQQNMMQSQAPGGGFGQNFSNPVNSMSTRPPPIQRPNNHFPRPRVNTAIGGMSGIGIFPPSSMSGSYSMSSNTNPTLQKRNSGDRGSPGANNQRPWSSDLGNSSATAGTMGKFAQNFIPSSVTTYGGNSNNLMRNMGQQQPAQFRRDMYSVPNSMAPATRFNSNFKQEMSDPNSCMMGPDGRMKQNPPKMESNGMENKDVNHMFSHDMVGGDVVSNNDSSEMGVPVSSELSSAPTANEHVPGSNPQNSTLLASAGVENNSANASQGSTNPNTNMSIAVD
ncbi:uncharacterized protein LOC134852117 isoform X2 [Symsagittifera roscoffensis]|uniref:uncharacterized protein LOC134852117 isoform X2 n=1 Tax=Symsagittifera roscoffensis TaxID=84072 RepID=UPI00307BB853